LKHSVLLHAEGRTKGVQDLFLSILRLIGIVKPTMCHVRSGRSTAWYPNLCTGLLLRDQDSSIDDLVPLHLHDVTDALAGIEGKVKSNAYRIRSKVVEG
jgi:hypothetical protein